MWSLKAQKTRECILLREPLEETQRQHHDLCGPCQTSNLDGYKSFEILLFNPLSLC